MTLTTTTQNSECDDANLPPSLKILLRTLQQLTRGVSDIRGRFVDHARVGSVATVAREIGKHQPIGGGPYAPLTPFAAYCLGFGFAQFVWNKQQQQRDQSDDVVKILLGQDPRPHGMRLADAFARGAEEAGRQVLTSSSSTTTLQSRVQVFYTGIATTPACAAFSSGTTLHQATTTASVMVTASHLPLDRNGFKLFYNGTACTKNELVTVGDMATTCAMNWYTQHSLLPPTSGDGAVLCTSWVDFMPCYAASLKQHIQKEVVVEQQGVQDNDLCLKGLTLVLNAGHGSGGFFASVLEELGANVVGSIGTTPDPTFPLGIPNPEYQPMMDATIQACQKVNADLGIMLDTDSDRCGFIVPATASRRASSSSSSHEGNTAMEEVDDGSEEIHFEPLNRNRLIAIMGVIISKKTRSISQGKNNGDRPDEQQQQKCGIVTDSVTSEGLSTFLQDKLGLVHVRYLKGYQNVIDKAKELTESGILNVELAMETSGHGAMKENNYVDDGTYTAVKVVSLLARQKRQQQQQEQQQENSFSSSQPKIGSSLLDLIADMEELDVIQELRFKVLDDSLDTMRQVFDFCALEIENKCLNNPDEEAINNNPNSALEQPPENGGGGNVGVGIVVVDHGWSLDMDNLEGIRVRLGDGQFFMLRKSLHDPIISLQIEAASDPEARQRVIKPLLELFQSQDVIQSKLDLSVLQNY